MHEMKHAMLFADMDSQTAIYSPVIDYLSELHRKYAEVQSGAVADYIPELAKANPDWFGISVTTADGRTYEVGDTAQPFTIQSISKPFTYGIALQDHGRDAVLPKIGMEPTGDAFNSISLAPQTGAPLNPMINAGAIAACGLVFGESGEAKFARDFGVVLRVRGKDVVSRRSGVPVRMQYGPPQPRHRTYAAKFRHHRG